MTQDEIKQNIVDKMFKEVLEKRSKIIDDFLKAYIASRWDYFGKKGKIEIGRIQLVEKKGENKTTFYFELRKGKIKITK